jgi:DNA-binding NtrC family response regulator
MLNLPRIFGHHGASPLDGENGTVRLLTVSRDAAFCANLRETAASCGWEIRQAGTVEEAIRILMFDPIPLIVYDWNSEDDDWQAALERLNRAGIGASILLASRVADRYLWQEVIRLGGYDLLPRSASKEELIRTLRFAWFWKRSLQMMDDAKAKQAR